VKDVFVYVLKTYISDMFEIRLGRTPAVEIPINGLTISDRGSGDSGILVTRRYILRHQITYLLPHTVALPNHLFQLCPLLVHLLYNHTVV
jgi:hypothetical protein